MSRFTFKPGIKTLFALYILLSLPAVSYTIYRSPHIVNAVKYRLKDRLERWNSPYRDFVLGKEKSVPPRSAELDAFTRHKFVAHAGGALFDGAGNVFTYTNAKEAVLENYEKGHRVFELDLNLTSDGVLVCCHDWTHANSITNTLGGGEVAPTLAEWKRRVIYERWTTMDIDDVMDLLYTHGDMWLVTDSKEAQNARTIEKEFREIYRAASARDIALLNRVVPQIYNPAMLKTIYKVYPFPNVIYTLYQSSQAQADVARFVAGHPSIKAVTMWGSVATEEYAKSLSALDCPIYCHTINSEEELAALTAIGVHGVYTDTLHP